MADSPFQFIMSSTRQLLINYQRNMKIPVECHNFLVELGVLNFFHIYSTLGVNINNNVIALIGIKSTYLSGSTNGIWQLSVANTILFRHPLRLSRVRRYYWYRLPLGMDVNHLWCSFDAKWSVNVRSKNCGTAYHAVSRNSSSIFSLLKLLKVFPLKL